MNKTCISAASPAFNENLEDSGCGYCQKHAGKPEEVSENADGEKDEKRVETGGVSYDVRVNKVCIHLLNQEQYQYGGGGFCQAAIEECSKSGRNHAEDGAEVGNQVQKPAENADNDSEVHLQQGKGHRREECHNQAVDKCGFQECINYRIDFVKNFAENAVMVLFQCQGQEPVPQEEKEIPVFQKVYGSNDSQKKGDRGAGQ